MGLLQRRWPRWARRSMAWKQRACAARHRKCAGCDRRCARSYRPQPAGGSQLTREALAEALGHAARPGPRPAVNPEVDAALYEALKGPFLLRFPYRTRGQAKPKVCTVRPHGLLLGTRRYLVARDTAKPPSAPLQHFRVEEIERAEVLPESFDLDAGFDICRHAEKGFGSFENASEHGDVVWRFSPDAAPPRTALRFPLQSDRRGGGERVAARPLPRLRAPQDVLAPLCMGNVGRGATASGAARTGERAPATVRRAALSGDAAPPA